jgi:hypothetical protein
MADRATTERGSAPEEIRQEIQRTRSAMDHTVDELAERLSPGRLLDEVWHRVRSGGVDGLASAIRDHPIPVALMGLGLGWLAIEQATGRSVGDSGDGYDDEHRYGGGRFRSGPGTDAPAQGRRGPYRGEEISGEVEYQRDPYTEESKAEEATGSAKERAGEMASRTKHRVSEAASTAGEATAAVRHGARSAGRKAKSTFSSLMEDNPLAVGAVAFGLGLASGVSAPSTSVGNRLMGPASDELGRKAKDVGRETVHHAKGVARGAARAAADEARAQREERDLDATAAEGVRRAKAAAAEVAKETEEAAREVGSAAKRAAKERARVAPEERKEGEGAHESPPQP